MRRRLFNLAAAVSLVLCVATAALWVRSDFVVDRIRCDIGWDAAPSQRGIGFFLSSSSGRIRVDQLYSSIDATGQTAMVLDPGEAHYSSAPIGHYMPRSNPLDNPQYQPNPRGSTTPAFSTAYFDFPIAIPLFAAAILPAVWIGMKMFHYRKMERDFERRMCSHCGYDLRATPDRCPECGAEAKQGKQPKPQPAEGSAA